MPHTASRTDEQRGKGEQFMEAAAKLLHDALQPGWHGDVEIRATVRDGVIQEIHCHPKRTIRVA